VAAGGAARRAGWLAGPSAYKQAEPRLSPVPGTWGSPRYVAPAGSPQNVSQKTAYTRPGSGQSNGGTNGVSTLQIAHLRGPGVITSLNFQAFGVISVGFQVLSVKGGSGAMPLLAPSTTPYWIKGQGGGYGTEIAPVASNPAMSEGFVYPVQEIVQAAAGYAIYVDQITAIAAPAYVTTTNSTTTPAFTVGQQVSFQSAFANGYANISAVGTISSTPNAAWGAINSVRYTIFGAFPFEDEAYVTLSPVVSDAQIFYTSPSVTVSFTYQNLGSE